MDRKTEFEHGDQDYGSCYGWDPDEEDRKAREEALEKAKNRNPRDWAERPSMNLVRKARDIQQAYKGEHLAKQLFGPFWHENEIAILFGQTGIGKSALGMQIAECLARNIVMPPFKRTIDGWSEKMTVLYLDYEHSDRQFGTRYSRPRDGKIASPYLLAPNIYRGELYWNGEIIDGYEDFTDMLLEDIYQCVIDVNANVLIIDNLTFLTRGSAANSAVAFRMMNRLKKIQVDLGISILAIAHTPKIHEPHAMTENDLQGSIDISKVADSIFCIAKSGMDRSFRYLKQIKCRDTEIEYDEKKVVVLRLGKFDFASTFRNTRSRKPIENFLGFNYVATDAESKHVPKPEEPLVPVKRSEKVAQLSAFAKRLAYNGMSTGQIADKLGIPRTNAFRLVNKTSSRKNGDSDERKAA